MVVDGSVFGDRGLTLHPKDDAQSFMNVLAQAVRSLSPPVVLLEKKKSRPKMRFISDGNSEDDEGEISN